MHEAGSAKNLAGWEWKRDGWTDADTQPLLNEALTVLGPHHAVFAHASEAGGRRSGSR